MIELEKILDEHCTTTHNKHSGEEEIESSKEAVLIAMEDAFKLGQTLPIHSVSGCNMQEFMLHYQASKHVFTDKAIDVLKSYNR